jgi:hypothetical protein
MKNAVFSIIIIWFMVFTACKKEENSFKGEFRFDMNVVGLSSTKSVKLKSGSVTSKPFCDLTKFEIELIYINVIMYDKSNLQEVSSHTLLNRKRNEGVKLNLVNEKLSDKINLSFKNPIGNCVAAIDIGIGNFITVNGFVDSVGTKVRTSNNGLVSDGGVPQDYIMAIDTTTWKKLYNGYKNSDPLVEKNVEGFSLTLPYKDGNSSIIQMDSSGSTLEIKWLMDNAIYVMNDKWAISSRNFTTPFIKGQFVYEVYYLKRKNEEQYTDIVGGLFNNDGMVVCGQLNVGQIVDRNNKNVLLTTSLFGKKEGVGIFEDYFHKNSDGSIYFKVTQGNDYYSIFPKFIRGNHVGTVTRDDGAIIEYDCIKAE